MAGLSIPQLLTGCKLPEGEARGQFTPCQELRNRHFCLMTERVNCLVLVKWEECVILMWLVNGLVMVVSDSYLHAKVDVL